MLTFATKKLSEDAAAVLIELWQEITRFQVVIFFDFEYIYFLNCQREALLSPDS